MRWTDARLATLHTFSDVHTNSAYRVRAGRLALVRWMDGAPQMVCGGQRPRALRASYTNSMNSPLDSVPVSKSSTMPPGWTRSHQRSRIVLPSLTCVVAGYAAVIVQSLTLYVTSSLEVSFCHKPGLTLRSSGYRTSILGRAPRARKRTRTTLESCISPAMSAAFGRKPPTG